MKTMVLGVALAAALISPAAHAGIRCNITDIHGNALTYEFGPNTAGSVVETGFVRNGRATASAVGIRPIWGFSGDAYVYQIFSREAPGWSIRAITQNGVAMLLHSGQTAGIGRCLATGPAASVADQGYVE